jgi:hypothetical protein
MGLFKDSILNTFGFWRQYLGKLVLYQLFFSIFSVIGLIMMAPVLLIFGSQLYTYLSGTYLTSYETFNIGDSLSNILPMPFWIFFAVVGFIVMFIFGIAQTGGYPLLLKQASRKKKISIIEALKGGLKKIHKIFSISIISTSLLLVAFVVLFAFIIVPFSRSEITPSINPWSTISALLIFFALVIAGTYLFIRLIFSIPVLMIEDSGIAESIKRSWNLTKSRFWMVFGIMAVIGLIVGTINYILEFIPFFGYVANFLVFYPISGIMSTIIYYTMKSKISRKNK